MRKIFWLAVCLVLLAGCSGNNTPSANLPSKNNNGTQAINTPGDAPSAVPSADAGSEKHTGTPVVAPAGKVVEIKEKMFIAQTNDIYFNAEDYLGKTIKYEGIFDVYEDTETGAKYYSVIRYGPGCCGVDANAGFEVRWDEDYPASNDWVEAVGVLEEYEEDGNKYLRLNLSSLKVLPARGAEYVSQ